MLLYGSETWKLISDLMKQMETTEMMVLMQNVKDTLQRQEDQWGSAT